MSKGAADTNVMPHALRAWERFWFTPADPTLLGLIRLTCGLIVLYTLFGYGFQLAEFIGPDAWFDLDLRLSQARDRPVQISPLSGRESLPLLTKEEVKALPADEQAYVNEYLKKHGQTPPRAPFPQTQTQIQFIDEYIHDFKFDPRQFGLRLPDTEAERDYLRRYSKRFALPPPAYATSEDEERAIEEYIVRQGDPRVDPRRLYARGAPIWSLWFHVTDPTAMMTIHSLLVLASLLFMIGFATRLTAPMTWFAALCYIHRNPSVLFGADTMITILLTYLMIGPSGAALSVDRLIARWWARAKPNVLRRWYRLVGRPAPADGAIAPARWSPQPEPTIVANVAIRLLQVHVCIIYLAAGLSKLLGSSWWNGTAVWGTLANYEFAPMHFDWYLWLLRKMCGNELLIQGFLNLGTLFTLAFEIGYAFLIWRRSTRWIFLGGAIVLHGLIGVFMGLKTFALIMLVMNMAFLRPEEVRWLLGWFSWKRSPSGGPVTTGKPQPAAVGSGS